MTHPIGWWRFDEQHQQLQRCDTGQSIRWLAPFGDDPGLGVTNSANRKWQRFEYRDPVIALPLVVEWRAVPSPRFGRPLVWRVDYVRSWALWRRESGDDAPAPSYGLWRRIDDCVADGLPCWPKQMSSTDLAKRTIALNGGWLNGSWTPQFFRSVWGSSGFYGESAGLQAGTLIPADLPAPSPWQLRESTDAVMAMPMFTQLPALLRDEILTAARSVPYLASPDHSRLLVPLPLLQPATYRLDGVQRFLYADADFVTDAFHVGIGRHEGGWSNWSGYIERQTQLPLQRLTPQGHAAFPGAPEHEEVRRLLARPLAQALLDAWLTPGLWPVPVGGKPQTVFFVDWMLAGCGEPSRLEACVELEDPLNKLAVMFEEERDGIARCGAEVAQRGWWDFDFDSRSLVNRISGERLRYTGATAAGETLGFVYEHGHIAYPLRVMRHLQATAHNPAWILDHAGAARDWRERTGALPAYGLWRRVDDCAFDALLHWPELEGSGPVPFTVDAVGGWLNGNWTPALRRRRNQVREQGFVQGELPASPCLEPLDTPAPVWTFHDSRRVVLPIVLEGLIELDGNRRWLPRESPLSGLDERIPYQRRDDGRAALFPAGMTSQLSRGEDYMARAIFTYVDNDVFFNVHACSSWLSWFSFDLDSLFAVGLRDRQAFDPEASGSLPAEWFRGSARRPNLSLPLARRVSCAVVDAGLSWPGSEQRLLDDPQRFNQMDPSGTMLPPYEQSGVGLGRPTRVCVRGGYSSGRYTGDAEIDAWLE